MTPTEHAAALSQAEQRVVAATRDLDGARAHIARRRGLALTGEQEYPPHDAEADAKALTTLQAAQDAAQADVDALRAVELDVQRQTQAQRVQMWAEERDTVRARMNVLGPQLAEAVGVLEQFAREFGALERQELECGHRAVRYRADHPDTAVDMPAGNITLIAPAVRDLGERLARINL